MTITGSAWKRFFALAVGTTALATLTIFLFVVTIDPWNGLPLSPRLPRVPVTTASRYALPMVARDQRYDSAIIGTSTTIQLRPDRLNPLFGARFANLSILASTSYEQVRLLDVFLRAHPSPRFVIIGMDVRWCDPQPQIRYTSYAFPEWLYQQDRWPGYLQIYNLFAVQEAGSQLWAMLGLKAPKHGLDGNTDFYAADAHYDAARAHANIAAAGVAPGPNDAAAAPAQFNYTTHQRLATALAAIPSQTRKILFFVPFVLSYQGADGSPTRSYWTECKRRVTDIAHTIQDVVVADFMIDSPITRDDTNYFDELHYRPAIADRLAVDLARVNAGLPSQDGDYRLLMP
jgi:hypothetical protein